MVLVFSVFFFNDTATTEIYTLSLHDALPIWPLPHQPPQLQLRQRAEHVRRAGLGRRDERVHVLRLRRHATPERQLQSAQIDGRHPRRRSRERDTDLPEAAGRGEPDLFEDVGGAEHGLGALLNELVAADGGRTGDRSGHRQDLATLLQPQVRRDERARADGGFDHDDGARQPGDQSIAARERTEVRAFAGLVLRDEAAVPGHALVQLTIGRRLDDAEAGAAYTD